MGIFCVYTLVLFALNGCNRGSQMALNIFLGTLLYRVALEMKKEDTHKYLKTLIWVCIISLAYMFIQLNDWNFIYTMRGPDPNVIDPVGLLGIKSIMGFWMALGMVTSLLICPLVSILFLVPIYLSKATGILVGLGLAVPFFLFYLRRKLFYIFTPLLVIGGIAYVVFVDAPMGMMSTRIPCWRVALQDVFKGMKILDTNMQSPYLRNPLTGYGPDAVRAGSMKYLMRADNRQTVRGLATPKGLVTKDGKPYTFKNGAWWTPDGVHLDLWDNFHNGLIQLVYEFGVLGVFIIGTLVFYMVERFRASPKTPELVTVSSLILVFIGSSVSQFPLYLGRTGFVMPILLGLFMVHSKEPNKEVK